MKNNDCINKNCLREKHTLSDFLWFLLLGGIPYLIGALAIANYSIPWMLGYLAFTLPFAASEIRFLCSHCPYYIQEEGRKVHCKAMWGPTKWAKPRPGPLSNFEKAMLYLFFFIAFSFPIYWLILQWQFLILYLISIVNMAWTLGRYECPHCMFIHCPFNRVPQRVKDELLKENESGS